MRTPPTRPRHIASAVLGVLAVSGAAAVAPSAAIAADDLQGPLAGVVAAGTVFGGGAGDDDEPYQYLHLGDAIAIPRERGVHGEALQALSHKRVNIADTSFEHGSSWVKLGLVVDMAAFPAGTTFDIRRTTTIGNGSTADLEDPSADPHDDGLRIEEIAVLAAQLPDGRRVQIDPGTRGPVQPYTAAPLPTARTPLLDPANLTPVPGAADDELQLHGTSADAELLRPGVFSDAQLDPVTGHPVEDASYSESILDGTDSRLIGLIDPADATPAARFGLIEATFTDDDWTTHSVTYGYPIPVSPPTASTPAPAVVTATPPAPATPSPTPSAAPTPTSTPPSVSALAATPPAPAPTSAPAPVPAMTAPAAATAVPATPQSASTSDNPVAAPAARRTALATTGDRLDWSPWVGIVLLTAGAGAVLAGRRSSTPTD